MSLLIIPYIASYLAGEIAFAGLSSLGLRTLAATLRVIVEADAGSVRRHHHVSQESLAAFASFL